MNIQSMCARQMSKFHEFKQCFHNSKVDIICVTETWLSDKTSDDVVSIDGYKLIRNDRFYSRGGGICIYYKSDLSCKVIEYSELYVNAENSNITEYLLVEVTVRNEKFLLGVFYNPPRCDCAEFLFEKLTNLSLQYQKCVLIGDFNTDLMKHDNRSNRFRSVIDNLGFSCIGSEPTHCSSESSSLIDLLLTSDTDFIVNFNQVAAPGFSYHDIIFSSLNIRRTEPKSVSYFRDYSRLDRASLENTLNCTDWSLFYAINDSDLALNILNQYVSQLYDTFIPLRRHKPKRCNPWFNNAISLAMIERDIAYRSWVRSKNHLDHEQYKRIRNHVTNMIKEAKCNYVTNVVDSHITNKNLWKKLKDINVTTDTCAIPLENTCDEINEYFCSNFNVDQNLPPLAVPNEHGFKFTLTDEYSVSNAINAIKSNALGLDGIPLKFVKLILPFIITPITHVFNTIIKSCKFPTVWKLSKVIPIRKKPRKSDIHNLRPISILCALSKALEKILKNQIQEFLTDFSLLHPLQSGFRSGHNTSSALLKVHDDIHKTIDQRGKALLLLIDFSKAFDRVSHYHLLRKLSTQFYFSRDAVNLIRSYLTDRFQIVDVDGKMSRKAGITSGVPQGSVLGPLLFSLFINDLPSILRYCSIHMFADDVQIYICSTNLSESELARLINYDLSNIMAWSILNLLPINSSKTKIMFISRSRSAPSILPEIRIGNDIISYVNKASSLGIIFQNDLEWDSHIDSQCGKIFGGLRHLKQTGSMLPTHVKLRLFKALLLPHFTYGLELILNASARAIDRLRIALNCCVRWVFNLSFYSRVTHLQPELLGCSFYEFFKIRTVIAIFKIITTKTPRFLSDKFQPFQSIRVNNFVIPQYNTSHYGASFFVRGIVYWNQLSSETKSCSNISEFRRQSTQHFSGRN